ncbi:acetate uptake transporter family protein [Actinomadura sp. 1N219]|uniref:acetate uptake transporter family protein n=1 Tax=Actinomadura sp. 1N219 TaxID=3375152 RepID=UPI0037A79056
MADERAEAAAPAQGAAAAAPGRGADIPGEHALWEDRTRISLQPVAAPSILGLFAFAGAAGMFGAWQVGWYGDAGTPLVMWPLLLTFGGIAQLLAGMWAYRARDGLATAMHGMWGAFWIGFGLLFMLVGMGAYPVEQAPVLGAASEGFAFWWIILAVVTALGALAALGANLVMALLLAVAAAGAGFTAAGFWTPSGWALDVGGWLLVAAAVIALYAAAAMMFENTFGRTILPTFKMRARSANVAGRRGTRPLEYRHGEPGVKIGQ